MRLENIDATTCSWAGRLAALLPDENAVSGIRFPLSYQEHFTPAEAGPPRPGAPSQRGDNPPPVPDNVRP